jgi:hypothetical protein
MMKHLSRDERKEILKARPSAEFLELLEKIYESPVLDVIARPEGAKQSSG